MKNKSSIQFVVAASTLATLSGSTLASVPVAENPVFFSWKRTQSDQTCPPMIPSSTTAKYTYSPHLRGHDWGFPDTANNFVSNTWDAMESLNQPVAMLMRNRSAPWGSAPRWDSYVNYPYDGSSVNPYPSQLPLAIIDRSLVSGQVNYVLGDIEMPTTSNHTTTFSDIATWMSNIKAIVTGVDNVVGNPDDVLFLNPNNYNFAADTTVSGGKINNWNIKFGNYAMHRYPLVDDPDTTEIDPTPSDPTRIWSLFSESVTHRHDTFVSVDANVLMPVTYAYSAHVRHTDNFPNNAHFSGSFSPTVRNAYIWAGVERQSSAIREELLNGTMVSKDPQTGEVTKLKEVIPWVAPFQTQGSPLPGEIFDGGWMPPVDDFLATIKHLRLRGADGFYFFGSEDKLKPLGDLNRYFWSAVENGVHLNPWYTPNAPWIDPTWSGDPNDPYEGGYVWFEENALIAWEELDGEYTNEAVVYRLDTDKTTGEVVSAVNDKGRLHILVSYMKEINGGLLSTLDLDPYFKSAKDYTLTGGTSGITVSSYSHNYTSDFFTPDIDGDLDADSEDFLLWSGMHTNADERADWNQDGLFNSTDLNLYTAAFIEFNQ